jgi:hypothetical protein
LSFSATQHRVLCLYCGSTVVQRADAATPSASETPTLQPDVLDELKQYLLDGRSAEALRLYQEKTGATAAEASETLAELSKQLVSGTLVAQPLSNIGCLFVGGVEVLGLIVLIWSWQNNLGWVAGLAAAVMVFHTLAFARGLRTRLLYELGQPAPAVVQKFVRLGELKVKTEPEPVQAVRVWLEVRPAGRPTFPVEKNLMMRRPAFEQLRTGLALEVRVRGESVIPTAPLKILEH